jgi:hypothetical protein
MKRVFDYQQKRVLVDKFLQYVNSKKLSAKQVSSHEVELTINNEAYTFKSRPSYERSSRELLNR